MAVAGDQHCTRRCPREQCIGHHRVARTLRGGHPRHDALGQLAAVTFTHRSLDRGRFCGAERLREAETGGDAFAEPVVAALDHRESVAAREIRRDERQIVAQRGRDDRLVERPLPPAPVELPRVGDVAGVARSLGACAVERGLVLPVELLHRHRGPAAGANDRLDQLELEAVMVGVVVRLADQHEIGLRTGRLQRRARHDAPRACVPDRADERMVRELRRGPRRGAGAEREQRGGEGEAVERAAAGDHPAGTGYRGMALG